jgi:hypothetical protein
MGPGCVEGNAAAERARHSCPGIPRDCVFRIISSTELACTLRSIASSIFWDPLSAPIQIRKQPHAFSSPNIRSFKLSARVMHSKATFRFRTPISAWKASNQ